MTDPGLTNRLRQHSRRSGLMVGLTMLLTITICIGASTTIYAKLSPLMSDFVSAKPKATATRPAVAGIPAGAAPTSAPPAAPTSPPTAAAPTPTSAPAATANTFKPDYQVNSGYRVNFRSEPSTDSSDTIIEGLAPATPLQYTGTSDSSSGTVWMKFKLQDGTVGWIRQIDVQPYNAGQ